MGFTKPQYTQVPNELLDIYMRDMGEAELRVVLVAVRKTLGYHKQHDAISLTQFEKYTGMSRRSVINGIEQAVKRGLLKEVDADGYRGVKSYELIFNDDDQSTTLTSEDSIPVSDTTSELSTLDLVNVVHTQKKIDKRNTDKRALTEKNANGTHEMTSQNIAQNDTSAKRKRDPQYDAIAEVFETSLSGKIVNLQGQLFHSKKVRGEWESMKIHPPMSIDELREWARWEKKNMRRYADGQERMPATPEVIARHIEDWRKLRNPSPEPKYAFEPDWTKQRPETPSAPQPWNPMYDKNDPKTWVKKPDFWGQPYKYVLVEDEQQAAPDVDVSSIPF